MSEASTRDPVLKIIERFSSWTHPKNMLALILRYKSNLYRLSNKRRRGVTRPIQSAGTATPITIAELNNAEFEIFKYVQSRCFKEELGCLRQANQQATSSVWKKSSNIFKLDPTLIQGLIQDGGRLQRAPINTDAMHSVILPKKHHVVKLLIQHCHHVAGHSGLEYTSSLTRQRYWIINARSAVRNILNECFSCRTLQAPTAQQKLASLPEDRVTPSKPSFTFTGVDCFGSFQARRGRTKVKRYGVIFTSYPCIPHRRGILIGHRVFHRCVA